MQFESALLNGCVPIRWRGSDLVSICIMLVFQGHEKTPSFSSPMQLSAIQWAAWLGSNFETDSKAALPNSGGELSKQIS